MKSSLVSLLACPECRTSLELRHVSSQFLLADQRHIDSGVLGCERGHLFPILDEVPRLTPLQLSSSEERDAVKSLLEQDVREIVPEVLSDAQIEQRIGELLQGRFGIDESSSEIQRARVKSATDYTVSEYRGLNKHKYLEVIASRVDQAQTILEVGASLPGFMKVVVERYRPQTAAVVDLDLGYTWSFRTADRSIDLIKADCRRLPFKEDAFDLLTSAFMLEHIADWQEAIDSMLQVSDQTFVAFGPNRWFPYEIGHLDTPLAGTVPRGLAVYLAWCWLFLRGRKRPMHRIRAILDEVHHVSSREFRSYCRKSGARVENVFPELVEVIARDERATSTRSRRLIRAFPGLTRFVAGVMARFGVEPQMYHMLEKQAP